MIPVSSEYVLIAMGALLAIGAFLKIYTATIEGARIGIPGEIKFTAATTYAAGEVIQLSDGRAAVIGGAGRAIASGDVVTAYSDGVFALKAATGTTFALGAPIYWDVSANLAIAYSSAEPEDIYCGVCTKAKVSGQLSVDTELNVIPTASVGLIQSFVVEFDAEAGTLNATKTLIPAAWNKRGLLILDAFAEVTEVFAGDSEDQGIVTVKDTASSPATLSVLTPSNAGADAAGDIVAGTLGASRASTGAVLSKVAAGYGVTGQLTQLTSGTGAAGKLKVRVIAAPLV